MALGEQTVCAERVVKEAVQLLSSVTNVPITKELITSSRRVHAEYVLQQKKKKNEQRLREEKQRKQELMKKKQLIISVKKEIVCNLITDKKNRRNRTYASIRNSKTTDK